MCRITIICALISARQPLCHVRQLLANRPYLDFQETRQKRKEQDKNHNRPPPSSSSSSSSSSEGEAEGKLCSCLSYLFICSFCYRYLILCFSFCFHFFLMVFSIVFCFIRLSPSLLPLRCSIPSSCEHVGKGETTRQEARQR